jgi:hypothetical protein
MRHFTITAAFAIAAIVATAMSARADDALLRGTLEQIRCNPHRVLVLDRHDHGVVYRVVCLRRDSNPELVFCQSRRCDVLRRSRGDQE